MSRLGVCCLLAALPIGGSQVADDDSVALIQNARRSELNRSESALGFVEFEQRPGFLGDFLPASLPTVADVKKYTPQMFYNPLKDKIRGPSKLSMVHIPTNFGHTIERDALRSSSRDHLPGIGKLPDVDALASFKAENPEEQWFLVSQARGRGGEVWGMMNPDLRGLSKVGCDMYYTPQKYWPDDLAQKYFGQRTVFGILRDPYDRLVNEFRMQATDVSSVYEGMTRHAVSQREGSMEREGVTYKWWYKNCDVNGWVKEELMRYKAGDHYRGNCHMLPQSEFFEPPHGITLAIDNRRIPASFNAAMEKHDYKIRMTKAEDLTHNIVCNQVTAYSLDEDSKKLIREVYAQDFENLCKLFGYCDNKELTCMRQIPGMCGIAGEAGAQ